MGHDFERYEEGKICGFSGAERKYYDVGTVISCCRVDSAIVEDEDFEFVKTDLHDFHTWCGDSNYEYVEEYKLFTRLSALSQRFHDHTDH